MVALLKEAWVSAQIAYYSLALAQMGGAHKDVPFVVLTLRHLQDKRGALRGRWFRMGVGA